MTAAVALALAALAGAAAPAAEAARASPVRVDADSVVYAFQKREVTFSGANGKPVTMTRDGARLTCQRLVAQNDEAGQIVTAVCSGDVHFTSGARSATCERATYDGPGDRIVCEGSPLLKDGGSEARGTRLVYDLKKDQADLENAVVIIPPDQVDQEQRALEARRKERRR
ncbi:MAG TPA: LptA/OstA family protein [Anaeromyxobacter sp.]